MADSCPVLLGDPAVGMVTSAHANFIQLANGTYVLATQQAQNMQNFQVAPVQYSAQFNFNDPLGTFQRPIKPTIDEGDFVFDSGVLGEIPEIPEFDQNNLNLDDAGDFNVSAPNLQLPARPGPLNARRPGDAPILVDRVAPVEPDYVLPALPVLEEILVPVRPNIVIPEFTAQRPDVTLPAIQQNWSFTPEQYISQLLDKVKGKISGMLDGGTGLPDAIRNALWEKAAGRQDEQELRQVQEVTEDFAAMGFTEPNGILVRRIEGVRQANQNLRAGLVRDLAIADADMEQKNLFFSVEKGIQLEGVLQQTFMQAQQLQLDAAKFAMDGSFRVLDAQIATIRLEFEIFQTDAQVFEARIRGALALAEVYRTDVEAAKLRGEMNQQLVDLYEAQVNTVKAMADFYNSRVNGFKAQVEADVSRVEAFRAVTQAYAEQVRAKEAEWGGYSKAVDAELGKVQVFDTLSRAFATRVSASSDKNRVQLALEQTRIQQHEAELRSWTASLRQSELFLTAERERLVAVTRAAEARANIYNSEAGVETAASAARDRTFQLGLERESKRADVSLRDAEIRVQENIQLTGFLVELQKAVGVILAQLAAGAMSAVSYSASVSSGRSEGRSCNTNISLEGEV